MVEAVLPQFTVVSLGTTHGLKPGDKVEIYQITEVRNKKDQVVMRDEKRAGEATVLSSQADKSKIRCEDGLTPEEGWVVRAQSGVTLSAAPDK